MRAIKSNSGGTPHLILAEHPNFIQCNVRCFFCRCLQRLFFCRMTCRRFALALRVYDRVRECFVTRVFAMYAGYGADIRRSAHFDSDTIAFTNAALFSD